MHEPLSIGGILFSGMDQTDFTGPFEVLSRIPHSTFSVIAKTMEPIRDMKGLILTPEVAFADAPQLDVLIVPGGEGVTALMEDPETLDFIRRQSANARLVLSVCTGALLLGAAGLLQGRRVTTHWASHHFLTEFGAIPQSERVTQDGNLISTAGVTAGFDGSLWAATLLAGTTVAQQIQLYLEYSPRPPFQSGTPEEAPPEILAAVSAQMTQTVRDRAEVIARILRTSSPTGIQK